MGMNLLEYAKTAGLNTKRGTIIELFAKSNSLLNAMTFETVQGSGVDYDQEAALPGVAFRGITKSTPQAQALSIQCTTH